MLLKKHVIDDEGKPFYVCTTAAANKFLRIYYARVKECLNATESAVQPNHERFTGSKSIKRRTCSRIPVPRERYKKEHAAALKSKQKEHENLPIQNEVHSVK